MTHSALAALMSPQKWGAVAAVACLLAGGAGFMLYGARLRAQHIARRVDLVRSALRPASESSAVQKDFQYQKDYQGLTVAEQEQIARFFGIYGLLPARALEVFIVIRAALSLIFGILGYLAALHLPPPSSYTLACIGAILAWFAPMMPVRSGVKKHRRQISQGLPDALELLAICVDAGISLEGALHRVAEELRASQPSLAAELSLTWAQITLLPDRDKAFMNLAIRVGLPSLRTVASTLSQSMKFGTPLSRSLRTAASELSQMRLSQMEERAHRLPAMLTLPMMVMIMPTIFLLICGPAVIKIMDIMSSQ